MPDHRVVVKQLDRVLVREPVREQVIVRAQGPRGQAGSMSMNLDGGYSDSVYAPTQSIDAGGVS